MIAASTREHTYFNPVNKMITRYCSVFNRFEVGYYRGTKFIIVSTYKV